MMHTLTVLLLGSRKMSDNKEQVVVTTYTQEEMNNTRCFFFVLGVMVGLFAALALGIMVI